MKKTTIKVNPNLKFKKWKKPNKVYFTTLASVFKRYNDDLERADILFEAFSPERLEAQCVATDRLRKRLKDLNLERLLNNLEFEGVTRMSSATLDKRHNSYLKQTMQIAEDIVFITRRHRRYRLCSMVVKRRQILGYGVNSFTKTHPLQAKYNNPEAIYPCSEVAAIANAKRRYGEDALKGSTIYVARIKYTDADKTNLIQGLASPCTSCRQHIKYYGIKQVIYTNDDTGFTCEQMED